MSDIPRPVGTIFGFLSIPPRIFFAGASTTTIMLAGANSAGQTALDRESSYTSSLFPTIGARLP